MHNIQGPGAFLSAKCADGNFIVGSSYWGQLLKFTWVYFLLGLNWGVASHAPFAYMHAVSLLKNVLET